MRGDRGFALLEVLISLSILAVAGTSLVMLLSQEVDAADTAARRAAELRQAEEILARLSLDDARGLSIRLGERQAGMFVTRVERPRPGLFRIAVARAEAPDAELLVTLVHRAGGA